ncbi:hypothetical protein XELAEV_18006870mg [Xenopus laevis]|uniref:Uncharacterized protein n=1 Tax=Xenopus laevis TaxID=8355 RepID=A0A974I4T6_XENLA|nr:hypothetical protein XELAEV_18006870mg [Xenopus laevis]
MYICIYTALLDFPQNHYKYIFSFFYRDECRWGTMMTSNGTSDNYSSVHALTAIYINRLSDFGNLKSTAACYMRILLKDPGIVAVPHLLVGHGRAQLQRARHNSRVQRILKCCPPPYLFSIFVIYRGLILISN